MLSDALKSFGDNLPDHDIDVLTYGCLSPHHAGQFKAFLKQQRSRYELAGILKGDLGWPRAPEDRDILYFLAQSFRAQLIKDLPQEADKATATQKQLAHRAKALMKDLAAVSLEMAQLVVGKSEGEEGLPGWLMVEIVRDLPRLAERRDGSTK
jgi:hypothetical protein